MNRDAVLATIIGFAIGLTITGIFLLGPNLKSYLPAFLKAPSFSKVTSEPNAPAANLTPAAGATQVSIDSPLADAVVGTDSLLVSGTAPEKSTVLIEGENDDVVVIVGNDGKFAGKLTLNEGKNDISVTGYDQDGKASGQTVTVYYTAETI